MINLPPTQATITLPHSESQELQDTQELPNDLERWELYHPDAPLDKHRAVQLSFRPENLLLKRAQATFHKTGDLALTKLEKQTKLAYRERSESPSPKEGSFPISFKAPTYSRIYSTEKVGIAHVHQVGCNDEQSYFSLPLKILRLGNLAEGKVHGITDGHGDTRIAAGFVAHYFPLRLEEFLTHCEILNEETITNALTRTCIELDAALQSYQPLTHDIHDGGTSLIAALELAGVVYIPNVGTSRALLVKTESTYQLTEDGNPNRPRFARGLQKIGSEKINLSENHHIFKDGVLAIARDIGLPILPVKPKITMIRRGDERDNPSCGKIFYNQGEYLVLADGNFWEVATNEEIASSVRLMNFQYDFTPGKIAATLAEGAKNSKSQRNLSVVVIKL